MEEKPNPTLEEDKKEEEKPTPDNPPEEDSSKTIQELQDKVNTLVTENESLKEHLESQRTKNEELASAVLGIKDELKKFKEAYAEQFTDGSAVKQPQVNEPTKVYENLVDELFDLVSK